MKKKCPVCRKFTFELFKEETRGKGNISLKRCGSCNNCGFYYDKGSLNKKTFDEQVREYKTELAIISIMK